MNKFWVGFCAGLLLAGLLSYIFLVPALDARNSADDRVLLILPHVIISDNDREKYNSALVAFSLGTADPLNKFFRSLQRRHQYGILDITLPSARNIDNSGTYETGYWAPDCFVKFNNKTILVPEGKQDTPSP